MCEEDRGRNGVDREPAVVVEGSHDGDGQDGAATNGLGSSYLHSWTAPGLDRCNMQKAREAGN